MFRWLNNVSMLYVYLFLLFRVKTVKSEKFVVSKDVQNWFQALINCKNAGMELVSIHTEEEQKELEKFMDENGHNKGYWLSGTKLGNGEYYWVSTGIKTVYTKWLIGQPDDAKMDYNNNEGEHCIQWGMPSYSPTPIGWNDLGCHAKLFYICQMPQYCYASNEILKI